MAMAATDAHRDAVMASLREWYGDGGMYGTLTQLDHALQCARQAEMAGAPDEVVIGTSTFFYKSICSCLPSEYCPSEYCVPEGVCRATPHRTALQ